MKKRKKIVIFISLFAFSVLINVIPLIVFKDKAAVSEPSYAPITIMIASIIYGIDVYRLRYKGVMYLQRLWIDDYFSDDKDYTFTDKYMNDFYWMSLIYWFTIPFYIPCIFFISEWKHVLWAFCVYFASRIIYLIWGIFDLLKDVKEYRLEQQKQAQELKEQQAREEMGRFR